MQRQRISTRPYFRLYLFLGIILFGLFYFLFDPMESWFMPQCVFHHVTGLQCMGCGSQRVIHSLLHGNLHDAFRANAFVTLSLPLLAFLLWLEIYRTKFNRLYSKVYSAPVIWTIAASLIIWFIVRNILHI